MGSDQHSVLPGCCLHPFFGICTTLQDLVLAAQGSVQPQALLWGARQSQKGSPPPCPCTGREQENGGTQLKGFGFVLLQGWGEGMEGNFLLTLSWVWHH